MHSQQALTTPGPHAIILAACTQLHVITHTHRMEASKDFQPSPFYTVTSLTKSVLLVVKGVIQGMTCHFHTSRGLDCRQNSNFVCAM